MIVECLEAHNVLFERLEISMSLTHYQFSKTIHFELPRGLCQTPYAGRMRTDKGSRELPDCIGTVRTVDMKYVDLTYIRDSASLAGGVSPGGT